MSKEGAIPVVQGMWMASVILLPIGLFFTYKATSDSNLLQLENYGNFFKKLFKKKKKEEA